MIKKLSTYFIILVTAIIIAFILAVTFKNLFNVYTKVKENNKKINFLENKNKTDDTPSLCFQSAYELAKKTNTQLPKISPLGTIPLKSRSRLINIDRYGFRNNDSLWKKNKHDFLILGDSVVTDNTISDENIFSNNFKDKSAINLGCGGNGLLTSLHLIEQIVQTKYQFNNILFFINLNNDFSKDTIREYNTQLFLNSSILKSKNIFLNEEKYKQDLLNFIKEAFSKSVSNFSLKDSLYNELNIKKYFEELKKLSKLDKQKMVTIADGRLTEATLLPKGSYNVETYNIFLKILERIMHLKQTYNINVTFIFVPTNDEINFYNSDIIYTKQWKKYFNYKFLKNTAASTIANFNFDILDLYYFLENNDFKGFKLGHFQEEYHEQLGTFINNNISNKTNRLLRDLYYYNSFYPSNQYFNYAVNFGKKLGKTEINNWINTINSLLKLNLLDNYLLTPSLGYFFINKDCDSILKLHKLSKAELVSFSVGNFFYKTCNLNNSDNIMESIKEINILIDKDVKYYIPEISDEVKKSLIFINEN